MSVANCLRSLSGQLQMTPLGGGTATVRSSVQQADLIPRRPCSAVLRPSGRSHWQYAPCYAPERR